MKSTKRIFMPSHVHVVQVWPDDYPTMMPTGIPTMMMQNIILMKNISSG